MLTNCWKFQNRNVQTFGFVYRNTNGLNHGPVWKIQSFLLKGICTVIPGRTIKGTAIWESSIKIRLGKSSKLGMFFVNREKGLFLSVCVDDIKLAGKKQNLDSMWKVLNKEVDLGEPTSVLEHVYLGCTQRECQISKNIVDSHRNMFESRISASATEKLSETKATGKPDAETISSWSYDMEGHAKKCVERYCELANKTTHQ